MALCQSGDLYQPVDPIRGQRLFTESSLYDSVVQTAPDRTAPFMHSLLLRKTNPQRKKLGSSPAALPASGRAGPQPAVPLLVPSFVQAESSLSPQTSLRNAVLQ